MTWGLLYPMKYSRMMAMKRREVELLAEFRASQ
jgi:hypothetical protein